MSVQRTADERYADLVREGMALQNKARHRVGESLGAVWSSGQRLNNDRRQSVDRHFRPPAVTDSRRRFAVGTNVQRDR